LLVVLSRSTPLPPAARLSIPSASSRPANPMSTATAALAAARSPAVALLSLRRRAHAAAPIRFPGLRVGSGCRHVAMASAAHARAPTDPLPKVRPRRKHARFWFLFRAQNAPFSFSFFFLRQKDALFPFESVTHCFLLRVERTVVSLLLSEGL
jgi:hypothetical protein